MAITFKTAPIVAAGDPITSAQFIAQADAMNDRLRSGIGDPTFRIHQLALNAFRQPRNPLGSAFPPKAEFQEFYSHIDPDSGATWPDAPPGTATGANLASQMMAFVFGTGDIYRESTRLNEVPLWLGGSPPTTNLERWILGKYQRGAVDPSTGNQFPTAFIAAQEHFKIVQHPLSNHGKSYGSFQPTPLSLGSCGDFIENRQIFFTSVVSNPDVSGVNFGTVAVDGESVSYACTCPSYTAGGQPNCIESISRTPFAYYLRSNDGVFDRLPISDWIEGPYTGGGQLNKPVGDQISHFLNAFLQDFRGLDKPVENIDEDIANSGFDFQRFLSSQYFLSPNIGHTDGGEIVADYPSHQFTGSTTISDQTESTPVVLASGFVAAVAYIASTELQGQATVSMIENGVVVGKVYLTEEEPDSILTISNPIAGATIKFRLEGDVNFLTTAGAINIETTEQGLYKPHLHDAYLVLRLMATKGDPLSSRDGSGLDENHANYFSNSYFFKGYISNPYTPAPAYSDDIVNSNPVFDAARRLVEKSTRIVTKESLQAYAVEGGKSVLYFERHALGNTLSDQFQDFAPSASNITSGNVLEGVEYIVRSGTSVKYNGTTYTVDQTFTGVSGVKELEEINAVVREYQGIRPNAHPKGFSREWTMFTNEKIYSPSDSSPYKEDAYSKFFPFVNRCVLRPFRASNQVIRHFNEGVVGMDAPESPSGYNYINGIHTYSIPEDHYKSCRIYEPDDEIESCISYQSGGIEVVKLTFKTRFHHTDVAPSTIDKDPLNWTDDPMTEPFRTRENAIRSYIKSRSGIPCLKMTGDKAPDGIEPTNTYGACHPHFFFTRLIPKPYADSNNTGDEKDTLFLARSFPQMAFYLRAVSEGYIDGVATENNACSISGSNLYDYSFENLCNDAFGGRWFTTLPESIRQDKPEGFGPLINTIGYASQFNQFSKCLNKLDKARIELSFLFETKDDYYEGTKSVTVDDGSGGACTPSYWAVAIGVTPVAQGSLVSSSEFSPDVVAAASSRASFNTSAPCSSPTEYNLDTVRNIMQYRYRLTDPNSAHAIPDALRDMVTTGQGVGFLATYDTILQTPELDTVSVSGDADGCCAPPTTCSGHFWNSPTGYADASIIEQTQGVCTLFSSGGTLDAGPPPSGDFKIGSVSGNPVCFNESVSEKVISPTAGNTQFITIPLV